MAPAQPSTGTTKEEARGVLAGLCCVCSVGVVLVSTGKESSFSNTVLGLVCCTGGMCCRWLPRTYAVVLLSDMKRAKQLS